MKYILYGAGHDGIVTMKYLGKENIKCFCDTYKCGGFVDGIPVIGLDELKSVCRGRVVVIAVSKINFILEIAKKLSSMEIDFVFWQDVVTNCIRQEGKRYTQLNPRSNFSYQMSDEYLIFLDRYSNAGTIGSYFWQDLWASRLLYEKKPQMHYDIGSRVDGFIAHLLTFGQPVTQIDIRPLDVRVENFYFVQADATNLDGIQDQSIDSLSALCSLEHFGLGRYGDPIDPEACFKCFEAIQRKMKKGGIVYLSVPIGKEHLEFNAHRVFYPQTIVDAFNQMSLVEFSSCYKEQFECNIDLHKYDSWCEHGGERFGLFVLKK